MKQAELLHFLKTRRSSKISHLSGPAPSTEDITEILQTGARVPDHGKMNPWYFIVLQGDARKEAGELLKQAYATENPDAAPAKLDYESEQFMRAPLIIAVVSRIRNGKHPQWEQILSAGAVCYNISIAANALGYGANWLTEWYSYSPTFKTLMGLDERDHFAGFIYIGTETQKNEERERPDLDLITTYWSHETPSLNKGQTYDTKSDQIPDQQFKLL